MHLELARAYGWRCRSYADECCLRISLIVLDADNAVCRLLMITGWLVGVILPEKGTLQKRLPA